jgi:hypothetical protein
MNSKIVKFKMMMLIRKKKSDVTNEVLRSTEREKTDIVRSIQIQARG